jgi:acyl carrier protein
VQATAAQVRDALATIARGMGYAGPLAPGLRLAEDLGLDSVGLLTLAVEVEDHFRVCLDADDEAAIRTLGDLERVLLGKLESG